MKIGIPLENTHSFLRNLEGKVGDGMKEGGNNYLHYNISKVWNKIRGR